MYHIYQNRQNIETLNYPYLSLFLQNVTRARCRLSIIKRRYLFYHIYVYTVIKVIVYATFMIFTVYSGIF